jgi:tetratricopeptide (TPR) repeat protein
MIVEAFLLTTVSLVAMSGHEYYQFKHRVKQARALRESGNTAQAIGLLETLLSSTSCLGEWQKSPLRVELAYWYLETGQPEKGLALCRAGMKNTNQPICLLELMGGAADCLDNLDDLEEAQVMLEKCVVLLKQHENDKKLLSIFAGICERHHLYDEAADAHHRCIELFGHLFTAEQRSSCYVAWAMAAHNAGGRHEEVILAAQNALDISADLPLWNSIAHRCLSLGYSSKGDYDQAEIYAKKALNLTRKSGNELSIYSTIHLANKLTTQKGYLAQAIQELEGYPDNQFIKTALFEAYIWQGELEIAKKLLRETEKENAKKLLLEWRKVHWIYRHTYAQILTEQGELGEALSIMSTLLQDAIADRKLSFQFRGTYAQILAMLGDEEGALEQEEIICNIMEERSGQRTYQLMGFHGLACSAFYRNDYEGTLQMTKAYLDMNPPGLPIEITKMLYYRAMTFEALGKTEQAIAFYRQAAQNTPETVHAQQAKIALLSYNSA